MQQWRIHIRGRQRDDIDIDLVVQAVLAMAKQLRQEESAKQPSAAPPVDEQPPSATETPS